MQRSGLLSRCCHGCQTPQQLQTQAPQLAAIKVLLTQGVGHGDLEDIINRLKGAWGHRLINKQRKGREGSGGCRSRCRRCGPSGTTTVFYSITCCCCSCSSSLLSMAYTAEAAVQPHVAGTHRYDQARHVYTRACGA